MQLLSNHLLVYKGIITMQEIVGILVYFAAFMFLRLWLLPKMGFRP